MDDRFNYLSSFKDRLLPLSVPYIFAVYSENNVKDYRREKIPSELFFQLVHFVLLFIEDRTIKAAHCTKEDIENEIKQINEKYFNFQIEDYEEVTQDIITHCIQNAGRGLWFRAFSPDEHRYENMQIKLVGDEFVKINGREVTSFFLTPQGLKYIYLTKELEEMSEIEFNQIKLLKSIRAGNFKVARQNVDALFYRIELQRKSVQYDRKRIITELSDVDIYEVFQDVSDSYELISSQRRENEDILKLIKEYRSLDKNKNIALWQKVQRDIDDISYIEGRLNLILDKQLQLVKDIQEFRDTLDEMLLDTTFLGVKGKLNILEDIIIPLEKSPINTVNPFDILKGLFTYRPAEMFSVYSIFSRQEILKERVRENNLAMEPLSQDGNTAHNENENAIRKYNSLYEEIFITILNKLEYNREALLKDMLSDKIFSKDIEATKVVLVNLFNAKDIDFEDDIEFLDVHNIELFNPVVSAKRQGYFLGGRVLRTYAVDDSKLNIESEGEVFKSTLTVPNMAFLLVRREIIE